jgi:hypothetical protein
MDFKLFIKEQVASFHRHFLRPKKSSRDSIDLGRYFYFEFYESEFNATMTPEALIKAINTRSRMDIPVAYTSVDSLNKLLESNDLYKVMTIKPDGSLDIISGLEQGKNPSLLKIKELNRLLIEANYPLETPKRQRIMMALQN